MIDLNRLRELAGLGIYTKVVGEETVDHFDFEVSSDDVAAKVAIALAKEGLTVDLEFAMDVFYFNFKTAAAKDKAKKLVKHLLDKDLKESIVIEGFDNSSEQYYEFTNGEKPGGRGTWMFAANRDVDLRAAKRDIDYFQSPPSTKYSDARNMAVKWAKEKGISSISVLP